MKKFPYFYLPLVLIFTSCGAQVTLSEERFDAENIEKVEIEGAFADVYIEQTSGKEIQFEGLIRGPRKYEGEIAIKSNLEGSTLIIWIEQPKSTWGNIDGELKLKLPANTNILAKNGSGNMYARGLEGEEISLKCSSGNLEANDLTGNIYLRTSSGNLRASGLKGNTSAKSSSGNLRIEELNGNLSCKSSSGRIHLSEVSNSHITAVTSSGGVTLQDVEGKLDVESSSGSIRGENITLTSDSFFESSSGSINIELSNDISTMSFDLKASSGGLRVGNDRSDDRLIIKRGGINVNGKSSSGSQYYYN